VKKLTENYIPVYSFAININIFLQTFTNVELLRQSCMECLKSSTTGKRTFFSRFTIRYSTNVLHFLACLQKSKEYKTKSENRPRKQLTLHIAILPWYLDLNEKCNKKYNKKDKWLAFFVIFITFLHFNPDYFVKLGCVCHRLCLLLLWTRGMERRRKVSSCLHLIRGTLRDRFQKCKNVD
jgi:hypothetical protein